MPARLQGNTQIWRPVLAETPKVMARIYSGVGDGDGEVASMVGDGVGDVASAPKGLTA